jgi:hypothetical protein
MTRRRALCAFIFFVFALLGSASAHAQEESPGSVAQKPGTENEEQFGAWRTKVRVDAAGQKFTDIYLAAAQPYDTAAGKQLTPDFVLSCRQGSTTAYIDMIEPIGHQDAANVNLHYAFDGRPPVPATWPLNDEQRFILSPDPTALIQQLPGKKSLAFEIRPYGLPRISAYFAFDNLEEVFNLMTERCYQ